MYKRVNESEYTQIRRSTLHELSMDRLPRRDLMNRLHNRFGYSERGLDLYVKGMVADDLIESVGITSKQHYRLTVRGYLQYMNNISKCNL